MTPAEIKDMIRRKAIAAGIDPVHALTMASIETGGTFDPNSKNAKHQGLYQFGAPEWQQYGGGKDILDPEANTDAFINYQGDINKQMTGVLGRAPTPSEQYLGWQQGATGASKLLSNPASLAHTIVGRGAVMSNGGSTTMTGQQFSDLWGAKYGQHQKGIMGQQAQWQGEGDTPPAAPTDPQAPDENLGTAVSNINALPDQGGTDWGKMAKAFAPVATSATGAGLGLLGGAQPQDTTQQSGPQAQAHRPDMQQMAGLLSPFTAQNEATRRKLMGLLGGSY